MINKYIVEFEMKTTDSILFTDGTITVYDINEYRAFLQVHEIIIERGLINWISVIKVT